LITAMRYPGRFPKSSISPHQKRLHNPGDLPVHPHTSQELRNALKNGDNVDWKGHNVVAFMRRFNWDKRETSLSERRPRANHVNQTREAPSNSVCKVCKGKPPSGDVFRQGEFPLEHRDIQQNYVSSEPLPPRDQNRFCFTCWDQIR